jgi:hypothetical protein
MYAINKNAVVASAVALFVLLAINGASGNCCKYYNKIRKQFQGSSANLVLVRKIAKAAMMDASKPSADVN